jgi:hypothetical protein
MAQELKEAGLTWKPGIGDQFAIPDRDLDSELFVLSNMTIQVYQLPEGRVIGFNGTTEWALDDIEIEEAIWLPTEEQLRELLGAAFRALRPGAAGFEVEMELLGETRSFGGPSAEQAYAAALLHLLAAAHD